MAGLIFFIQSVMKLCNVHLQCNVAPGVETMAISPGRFNICDWPNNRCIDTCRGQARSQKYCWRVEGVRVRERQTEKERGGGVEEDRNDGIRANKKKAP